MKLSSRQEYLTKFISEHFYDRLGLISDDNQYVLASLLAGALSFAERVTKMEVPREYLDSVCAHALDILQSDRDLTVFDHNVLVVRVAIARYREKVVPGLGGRQTLRIEYADSARRKSNKLVGKSGSVCGLYRVTRFFYLIIPNSLISKLISLKSKGGRNG